MTIASIRPYWANCFLLTIPVLIWDLLLTDKLPEAYQPEVFWHDIPSWITYGESISRTIVFVLTLLMPIRMASSLPKRSLFLYLAGLLIYFASWLPLIYFPASSWSNSLPGFMASAYTPVLWLTGIGLMGNSFYFNVSFHRWYFLSIALLFSLFHIVHTHLIYSRVHENNHRATSDTTLHLLRAGPSLLPTVWPGNPAPDTRNKLPSTWFCIRLLQPLHTGTP
jgi:hypothetical protein